LPIASASVLVRVSTAIASLGEHTIGSFSLKLALRTTGAVDVCHASRHAQWPLTGFPLQLAHQGKEPQALTGYRLEIADLETVIQTVADQPERGPSTEGKERSFSAS